MKTKIGWIGFPKEEGADYFACLADYVKLGYQGVEAPATEDAEKLAALGLEALTVSTSIEEVRDDLPAVIAKAKKVNAKRASIWASGKIWGDPPPREEIFAEFEIMETAAKAMAAEGIKLCYHNHDKEFFIKYDDITMMDHMMANTSALWLEADVCWVTIGGAEPVEFLKKYASRLAAVHIKDYIVVDDKPVFTSLGTGLVDLPPILNYLKDIQFDWLVFEQDQLHKLSSLETMTLSYLYMKELGICE